MGIILMIFIIPYCFIGFSGIKTLIKLIKDDDTSTIFYGLILSIIGLIMVHLDPLFKGEIYIFSFIPVYIFFLGLFPYLFSAVKYGKLGDIVSAGIAFSFIFAIIVSFLGNPFLIGVHEIH